MNDDDRADQAFDKIREYQKPLIGDGDYVVLAGKQSLPVSIVRREEFREFYNALPDKPWYKFW